MVHSLRKSGHYKLNQEKTALKELPDSIYNIVALKFLNLNFCKEFSFIPSSIYKLLALEKLLAYGFPKLEKFPQRDVGDEPDVLPSLVLLNLKYCNFKEMDYLMDLTCFKALKEMSLSGNGFAYLPACVSKFKNLEELLLCSCPSLVEVPELPDHAKLHIRGCRELRAMSNYLLVGRRTHRRLHMDLSNCRSLDLCNIDGSLSMEMIRGFGGSVEDIVPGKAFSRWMDFQITECRSSQMPLPDGMSEDDVLGLALSVTFTAPDNAGDIDWSNITFRVKLTGMTPERCGLRILCKQELDDRKFVVHKEEKIDDECYHEYE